MTSNNRVMTEHCEYTLSGVTSTDKAITYKLPHIQVASYPGCQLNLDGSEVS